jgi:hypothetical protein
MQSKSTWDLATSSPDTTAPQSNTTTAAFFVPPPSSVKTAAMSVPEATPVAMTAPVPATSVQTQRPPPPRTATVNRPPAAARVRTGTDIVTVYGTVYKNAQVEKVDSDGLLISYSTPGGGLGMAKVYFSDLPETVRAPYHK